MQPFLLPSGAPVAFGRGRLAQIGLDVGRLAGPGATVLVVADPFVAASGVAARVIGHLQTAGHGSRLFDDVASHPTAAQVDACAAAARSAGAACIVAVGGGSAMDVGKAAAALAGGEQPAEAYALQAAPLPPGGLRIICVPTTAGTGAEVTRTAVFSTASGHKVWTRGEALHPDLALLDPELTCSLPPELTAATGLHALANAVEAMTNSSSHPLADAEPLEAIRLISRFLPRAVQDGQDLEARGMLQIAACLAGFAIDVNGTAVAHAIGNALGAIGKVPHGRAVALALRVALPGNAKAAPQRHALVAEAFGLERVGRRDEMLAAILPAAFDGFLRQLGLEIGLRSSGLGPADAERLAHEALEPENRRMIEANCRPLSEPDLRELCQAVLSAS